AAGDGGDVLEIVATEHGLWPSARPAGPSSYSARGGCRLLRLRSESFPDQNLSVRPALPSARECRLARARIPAYPSPGSAMIWSTGNNSGMRSDPASFA